MRRRRPTAAWRLALPGIVVLALGSALVMVGGHALLSRSIRARGDAWMAAEVASLAAEIRQVGGTLAPVELDAEVRELELHEGLVPGTDGQEEDGLFFFAVMGSDGRVVASAVRGPQPALAAVLARLPQRDAPAWVRLPGSEYPVRVVRARLRDGRAVVGGATPYADAELLEKVSRAAVLGWLLMLGIATPVAWLAVRGALRRVDRLAEVAGSISVDALDRRLPEGPRGDEIDRLAATFNSLLGRAAAAVRQLRLVADAVAHDLRTPLTVIRGRLESAAHESRPERMSAEIASAIADVDELSRLVATTLDAAEAEAGAFRLTRSRVDLTALLDDLVELYEPAAAERGIALVVRPGPTVALWADETLLKRVIVNLLDNALAHLPAGSHVTVAARTDAAGTVLEVADDGPGFPPEVAERAFERLVRGAGSTGSGLGLTIVRAAAVAHGGRAELGRSESGGSVVRVTLPAPVTSA